MSRDYPDRVRLDRVATARRRFTGDVAVASLPRLTDLIATPTDNDRLSFELSFDKDAQGHVLADLRVWGSVPLICQRTLERFEYPIESQSRLGIVQDENKAAELPDDYEPLIASSDEMVLLDLVEEEVLLALPLVPTAPGTTPVGDGEMEQGADDAESTHRPFGILSELKKNQSDSSE